MNCNWKIRSNGKSTLTIRESLSLFWQMRYPMMYVGYRCIFRDFLYIQRAPRLPIWHFGVQSQTTPRGVAQSISAPYHLGQVFRLWQLGSKALAKLFFTAIPIWGKGTHSFRFALLLHRLVPKSVCFFAGGLRATACRPIVAVPQTEILFSTQKQRKLS